MKPVIAFRFGSLAACAALLAACGGGGSSDAPTPPPAPATYTVGGTLSGLATGASVVLQNNAGSNLTLNANGAFTFGSAVTSGGAYAVTVLTQPSGPTQSCTVASGSGTVSANVSNVAVTCVTSSFGISGTVSGLSGSIVLQNSGAGNQTISADGAFSFPAQASGSAYAVTVLSHPTGPNQTCTVTNGTGTIGAAATTNVAIACATTTHTIGGTVSGLAGTGLVLQDSSGQTVNVSANGAYSFSTALASGAPYAVTVRTPPASPSQTCAVTNGTGTIGATNVANINVACAVNTYTVGGTLSGLNGSVVLQNNGGSNLTLSGNGSFTFPAQNSGATYAVTVLSHPTGPSQNCVVGSGTGTLGAANVSNVTVTCTTNTYTVGGTVSGLATGGTVVLQNNAGNNLSVAANGSFTFSTALNSGATYAVTVLTQPAVPGPGQTCTVGTGSGTIVAANIGNVTVTCVNVDQTAPTVTARTPAPTAVGAKVQGGVITVTFSEAINPTTVNASSFTLLGPTGPVTGTISFATGNTQAIFTPTSPATLVFDDWYTATLTTAVRDVSNNALAANVSWAFNTGKKLAVGFLHTCARFVDGRVKCWGANDVGQLGYDDQVKRGDGFGPNTSTLAAVYLGTDRTAVALVAGDFHTCAILDNGDTKCWGENSHGELGQGSTTPGPSFGLGDAPGEMAALTPINFGGGRKAIEIAAGQSFSCARLDNNDLKCWGLNTSGQLGQGGVASLGVAAGDIAAAAPIAVGTNLTPYAITLGHYHVCATLRDGSNALHVKCWGDNRWGQLGRGNTSNVGDGGGEMGDILPEVNFGTGLTADYVVATGGHTCAKLSNQATKCWGLNTWGQAGLNGGNGAPVDPLLCTGDVKDCVGDNPGELGDSLSWTAAIAPGNTLRLTVGFRHACVVKTNGDLKCWGSNEEGQLGLGTNAGNNVRIGDQVGEIAALATTALKPGAVVAEISGGGFHTCVLNVDTTLNCWGSNSDGQLGLNNTTTWGDSGVEMGPNLPDLNLGP